MQKRNLAFSALVIFICVVSIVYLTVFTSSNSKKSTESKTQTEEDQSSLIPILDFEAQEDRNNENSQSAQLLESKNIQGVSTTVPYSVLTFDLTSTTVVTDTAGDDDCNNDCPTKPLSQYVKDSGGRAGMNGTYFCPPDYSWCSGKVNSYDFPVWNNHKKKWMQSSKLFWGGRGMFLFRPGSAQFHTNASAVGAPSDITGGIVNYPSLLAGGKVVLNEGSLPDSMKITKGTRSGIGTGGGKLFLVVARKATMGDLVKIFQSLGATDALNLDGGGSAALYQGKYKTGPGRSLPNAIVVK